MESSGWIKLHSKIKEWEWYGNPNMVALFIHILLSANWKDDTWHGIEIKRGSFVTSVLELSKKTGVSIMAVRSSLNKLKSTNEITIKTTNKYTVISINNYMRYQDITNKTTNEQQTNNKQTTNAYIYKDKKDIKNNNAETFISHFNEKSGGKHYQVTGSLVELFTRREKEFGLEKILLATDNLFSNPFMSGENDRGWCADPTYLLRSESQVDKFLNATPKAKIIKNNASENGVKPNFKS